MQILCKDAGTVEGHLRRDKLIRTCTRFRTPTNPPLGRLPELPGATGDFACERFGRKGNCAF